MSCLIENKRGQIICYTDGACFYNGFRNSSAGYAVVFNMHHDWNDYGPVYGRQTNNVAEIVAATHAVDIAGSNEIVDLLIRTDSQFMIDAYYDWMPNWKYYGWRKRDGTPVKNRREFQELDSMIEDYDINVEMEYVRAHKNDTLNNLADRLAGLGADGISSQFW